MRFNLIVILLPLLVVILAMIALRITPRAIYKWLKDTQPTLDDHAMQIAERVRRDDSFTPFN